MEYHIYNHSGPVPESSFCTFKYW